MSSVRPRHHSNTRRIVMAALDSCLLGGVIARWSYRCGLHGTLRVTSHELRGSQASSLPAPLVLAFASDFHAGSSTDPEIFKVLADRLNAARPDVILLGGDYVSCQAQHIDV